MGSKRGMEISEPGRRWGKRDLNLRMRKGKEVKSSASEEKRGPFLSRPLPPPPGCVRRRGTASSTESHVRLHKAVRKTCSSYPGELKTGYLSMQPAWRNSGITDMQAFVFLTSLINKTLPFHPLDFPWCSHQGSGKLALQKRLRCETDPETLPIPCSKSLETITKRDIATFLFQCFMDFLTSFHRPSSSPRNPPTRAIKNICPLKNMALAAQVLWAPRGSRSSTWGILSARSLLND